MLVQSTILLKAAATLTAAEVQALSECPQGFVEVYAKRETLSLDTLHCVTRPVVISTEAKTFTQLSALLKKGHMVVCTLSPDFYTRALKEGKRVKKVPKALTMVCPSLDQYIEPKLSGRCMYRPSSYPQFYKPTETIELFLEHWQGQLRQGHFVDPSTPGLIRAQVQKLKDTLLSRGLTS